MPIAAQFAAAPSRGFASGSGLLDAIKSKQLRKVSEEERVKKEGDNKRQDVAAILARRIAIEISDSESESDDWSDND